MRKKTFPWAIVIAALSASAVTPAPAGSRGQKPIDPTGVRILIEDSGGTARLRLHRATGSARFVRVLPGSLPLGGASPEDRGAEFFRRYGGIFGISDPETQLDPPELRRDALGFTHLVYQQRHRGVPVFAAQLRIHFDPLDRLTAVNGTFLPGISLDPNPRRDASEAAGAALARVRRQLAESPAVPLEAGNVRLLVYRTGLARGVEGRDHLAFEVEVGNGAEVREFVYVDAHTGKVVDQVTGIRRDLERWIHESQFGNVIWTEGDPLPGDAEAQGLIRFSEDVYDLFSHLSGGSFLSWDGADGIMHSVWKFPGSPSIPCPNAFWNGIATYYCADVATDDIAAHEWTHAYTDSTHDLIYQWQPGALNESYSDIFGEVVDLNNVDGTDFPAPLRAGGGCSTFTDGPPPLLDINLPEAIAGPYAAGGAAFNPPPPVTVTADVELIDDGDSVTDGCQPLVGFTPGKIALIDRGNCNFTVKVLNAQSAGAVGVIVVNNLGDNLLTMAGSDPSITIPSAFIRQSDGDTIQGQLGTGVNATITLQAATDDSLRWLMGEESTGFGGAIRDMWNPTCLADPGRVSDLYYHCGPASNDSGGVHTNSGIPNHAFTLLFDGGTFNGRTIAPLGLTKAAHIYWRAMEIYQVPDTDFADHADALEQSCADLVDVPLPDPLTGAPSGETISAPDCDQVSEAMLAVEMRDEPTSCAFLPLLDPDAPAVDCGAAVFSDDFETDPASAWTLTNTGVSPEYIPRDWEWTASVPPGGTGSAFFALDDLNLGNCSDDDQSGVMRLESPPITLPASLPILHFDHYVATEADWDGGNVKISVNGGPFQIIDPADFTFNQYNELLIPAPGNTNPLAGEDAFSGTNDGELKGSWGRSLVDLTPYAGTGDTIRLRFDFGVDGCNGLDGWYVDNVLVCLDCSGPGAADGDLDGARICDGDCDDLDGDTYLGAPEVNDGRDNQCPGDPGHGITDEISGDAGFHNPADDTEYSWTEQSGAATYQVARSTSPDFSTDCTTFTTNSPVFQDPDPPPGGIFFYLVRPLAPRTGSWGTNSAGEERIFTCGA